MAVVALNALPEKLNPVVRPLMDVIKKEENESLQVKHNRVSVCSNLYINMKKCLHLRIYIYEEFAE